MLWDRKEHQRPLLGKGGTADQKARPGMSKLYEIRKAWCEYNQIQGEWNFHLEEGGDTDLTRRDVQIAWEKLNNLIIANAESEAGDE